MQVKTIKRGFEFVTDMTEGVHHELPKRKTQGSACYDFYLTEDITVPANGFTNLIKTDIKAYMPEDEVLLLFTRSSVGLFKHITLANGTGIIDSDYYGNETNDGNIGFVLQNNGNESQTFKAGDRVVQGMFVRYGVIDDDDCNDKRTGGTGSTDK